ncbi:MAG: RsmD family RNA methyltransferase [Thermomicrobiales bacterium]
MRVISGEAKGFRLKGPAGTFTRPMADKIKGALFSMLDSLGVAPERVLDLYAGTGSIGIEALSRGAEWADFVDQHPAAAGVVRANLEHTKFNGKSAVHLMPAGTFLLAAAAGAAPYDLVIMDPPYADPDIVPMLRRVGCSPLVQSGSVVAIGHSPRVLLPERAGRLTRLRERCHGDSCFSVYEAGEESDMAVDDAAMLDGMHGDASGDLPGKLRPDHAGPHGRGAAGGRAVRRTDRGRVRRETEAWRALLD